MSAPLLSPPDAASELEQAQCASPRTAAATLRRVAPRLRHAHPAITDAALTLLEVHPHHTIPHIPDLISSVASDTSTALNIFSTLLQSDRTLLVPIIATLADLPLAPAHHSDARATLSFALSVVDEPDLPAVVRALLRSSADIPSAALWTAHALRRGLAPAPSSAILPLLSDVLSDGLRAAPRVARALRIAASNSPLVWPDLVVWAHSLAPRSALQLSAHARLTLHRAIRAGIFARPQIIHRALHIATPAFPVPAAAALASQFAAVAPATLPDILCATVALRTLLSIAPCATSTLKGVSLRSLARAEPAIAAAASTQIPAVAVARAAATRTWSGLLITLRKRLLFGGSADAVEAARLGAEIVKRAEAPIAREMLDVVDDCVPSNLALSAAHDMLILAVLAAARQDVWDQTLAKRLLRRVVDGCPEGAFVGATDDSDGMQIDIGLFWRQPPVAIASVVAAGALGLAASHAKVDVDTLATSLLDVTVLLPTPCISLYQAVHTIGLASAMRQGAKRVGASCDLSDWSAVDIPDELLDKKVCDLSLATAALGAGIAANIGILNASSSSLHVAKAFLEARGKSSRLPSPDDGGVSFTVLDRLTELHRMFGSVCLGHEVLERKANGAHGTRKRTPKKSKKRGRVRSELNEHLTQTGKLKRDIQLSFFADGTPQSKAESDGSVPTPFPTISPETLVTGLASVPDESWISDISTTCKDSRQRHDEVVMLDKHLLYLLLKYLKKSNETVRNAEEDTPDFDTVLQARVEAADVSEKDALLKIGELGELKLQPDLLNVDKLLQERGDIFYDSECDGMSDTVDSEDDENKDGCEAQWSSGALVSEGSDHAYLESTLNSVLCKEESRNKSSQDEIVDIIHSPTFVALLLDRAAMYVAVARDTRNYVGDDDSYLMNASQVAGMALSCLVYLLRIIPSMYEVQLDQSENDITHNSSSVDKYVRHFINKVGEATCTRVPPDESFWESVFSEAPTCQAFTANASGDDIIGRPGRLVSALQWISSTSTDAVVGTLAVEAIMTISEFHAFPQPVARKIIFSNLASVYEYDGGELWSESYLTLALQDSHLEWILRRRGQFDHNVVELLDRSLMICEKPPWIFVKVGSGKSWSSERHRLSLYFSGMHVQAALREGMGWARELSLSLGNSTERQHQNQELTSRFNTCDKLLDMLGLQAIVITLLQVVQGALEVHSISESLSLDIATDELNSPLPVIRDAVVLFCATQKLYFKNQQALFKQELRKGGFDVSASDDFAKGILTEYVACLQATRIRLDELGQWYSDPTTEVSSLPDATVQIMRQIIGGSATAVTQTVEVTVSIKEGQGLPEVSDIVEEEPESRGSRKSPGYSRGRTSVRRGSRSGGLSRARKFLPRLADSCEQLTKSTERVAKGMGMRAKRKLASLAPPCALEDDRLHFGIGLEVGADIRSADDDIEDESENGVIQEENVRDDVEGLLARGVGASLTGVRTVRLQFGREQ